jgi:hypothetical protein
MERNPGALKGLEALRGGRGCSGNSGINGPDPSSFSFLKSGRGKTRAAGSIRLPQDLSALISVCAKRSRYKRKKYGSKNLLYGFCYEF